MSLVGELRANVIKWKLGTSFTTENFYLGLEGRLSITTDLVAQVMIGGTVDTEWRNFVDR